MSSNVTPIKHTALYKEVRNWGGGRTEMRPSVLKDISTDNIFGEFSIQGESNCAILALP